MRPIMLSGHERALTQVKYNAPDGDLIFSVSKDMVINVWYSHNGERLGTYTGHNGTVWTIDSNSKSTLLVSGSADNTLKLWNLRDGSCLFTWDFPTAVKRACFSEDDSRIVIVTEKRMGYESTLQIFQIDEAAGSSQSKTPESIITPSGSKASVVAWSYMDKYLVTGHEDGKVALFDPKSGEELHSNVVHEGLITDLQMSPDGTWFMTSSKDKSAKIIDVENLDIIKTFTSDAPLNSAACIPGRPYVLMGGGQDAQSVTTTSARQGHFEIRMCHQIFEEEVARIKGGFGPCNTIATHPQGTGYAIGGEDGYVRLHRFDADFYTAKPFGLADQDVQE